MRPSWLRCGIVIGLLLASIAPAGAQSLWWKSDDFKRELGLTLEQSTRIDTIFRNTLPKLKEGKRQLDEKEGELSRLIQDNADAAAVGRHVDKVEAVRSALNKERTLMLLHMRQVLTPDQRLKLQSLNDTQRRHRRSRQGTGTSRP
jgi:Spy/CpxP family protein refolding chaperone